MKINPVSYFQGLSLCLLGFAVGKLLDFTLNLPITMFQDERQNFLSSILIKASLLNEWLERNFLKYLIA